MMRLDGKVALVTGSAQGIGRGIAERFLEEGCRVFATDVSPVAPLPGNNGVTRNLDVANPAHWTQAVQACLQKFGKIDILANVAGVVSYKSIDEESMEDWLRAISINQTGVWLGMKTVIPIMKQNNGGSIINISSIWGTVGVSGCASYQATKGAVLNLSKNGAITYAKDNIRVNAILPGIIDTPMVRAQPKEVTDVVIAATPLQKLGVPRDIANGALYLASDESSFVTGLSLVIDGGYTAQ
jgi:NAD(P)-dependent dehydrogenase (short-subunit alcohol dehydrogenase family)